MKKHKIMQQKKYIARSMVKKELKFTPKKEKGTKIARPRNAASLVLLKKSNKEVKVLSVSYTHLTLPTILLV